MDLIPALILSNPWLTAALLALAALLTAPGRAAAIRVLLWLDCLVNAILGGLIKETLSSRAHRMRVKGHRYWGWTADAIDALFFFQPDHCRKQYWREVADGWHD